MPIGRWIVITLLGAVGVAGCFESHLNSRGGGGAGGGFGGHGGGFGGHGGGGFGGFGGGGFGGGGFGGHGGGGFGGHGGGGFGGFGGGGYGGGGFGGSGGFGGGGFGGYGGGGYGGGGSGGFGGSGGSGCLCDDGDPCTADRCDPLTGWCTFTPQQEICDQRDNDCDGSVDENAVQFRDADGDGFGDGLIGLVRSCEPQVGYVLNGDDCDDGTRDRYPGAPELCDRLDNDCDGVADSLECPELYDCAAALALRCFPGATCVQESDTARCSCPPGYLDRGSRTGEMCEDIDECLYACTTPNTCINTPGSFECSCAPSYVAWGGECVERCNEDCSPFANNLCVVLGAPICLCRPGFHDVYNGDGGYRDCLPD